MYEDDDKTDGSPALSRDSRCLARATASVLTGSDGAGESLGGMAQAKRLREKRAERRAAKVVSDFSRRRVKSRGTVEVHGQSLSAKRSLSESTAVCRLKPLTTFAPRRSFGCALVHRGK